MMEEKNKYYTPDISEFHVGFEYEQDYSIVQLDHEALENPWEYKIFEVKDYKFIDHLVETKFVRVKYLDREDIESLGWTNYRKSILDWYEINLLDNKKRLHSGHWISKFILNHDRTNRYLKVDDLDYNLKLIAIIDGTEETLFEGIIKNKSELKKLLKQLNIVND